MWTRLKEILGFTVYSFGVARSSGWPAVRKAFITLNPQCAVCGTRQDCEVHHIEPFHLKPELEFTTSNLITLCRDDHRLFGHLLDWSSFNKTVADDAAVWRTKIYDRP